MDIGCKCGTFIANETIFSNKCSESYWLKYHNLFFEIATDRIETSLLVNVTSRVSFSESQNPSFFDD